jgi:V/A-type H+-transporting ATPase subunit I
MLAKMKKVSLIGDRKELKNTVELLKAYGEFQITFYKNGGVELHPADDAARAKMTNELNSIRNMLAFAKACDDKTIKRNWDSVTVLPYSEIKKAAKKEKEVINFTNSLERLQIELNDARARLTKNCEMISGLSRYTELPIAMSLLKNTKHTFTLCGIIAETEFARYKNDIDTSDWTIETYPVKKDCTCVVISGDIEQLSIADAIYNYGFTECQYKCERTAQEEIDYLRKENETNEDKIKDITKKCQLSQENISLLKLYYDYLLNELDTYEILTSVMQTRECFIVNGWITARSEQKFRALIEKGSKHTVIKITEAADTDNPPVSTRNTPIVAPYNSVTAMYGMPSKTDIDPNPFVAFFYFLFFGIMFGDMGYGLLLFGLTAAILFIKKPRGGMKQMMALFLMGGISAVLWGFVFNSFFGMRILPNLFPTALLDPMSNAILFLSLSLYFGIIHLSVGLLINFYNKLRLGKMWDAFLRALPHFLLLAGLAMAFPTLINGLLGIDKASGNPNWVMPVLNFYQPITQIGIYIALAGVAGIILFNGKDKKGVMGKLIGGLGGAYGLVNYFSDILSYARLFGVGLAGCVIGYVANYLCGMFIGMGIIGIPIGVIIAIFFHGINIGLGLLSAYVHDSRLQFIEFFGKFYSGEGKAFAPLCSQLRYTKIKI